MDIFVIDNKIGIDMKNFFTLLMVLLVISSVCSYADEKDGGNTSKSIKIISNKGMVGQNHSFGQEVFAQINFRDKTIEIELYNFSGGEIYIQDGNNQVIDMMYAVEGDSLIIMNQPEKSGSYVLIIYSHNYYGEGYFNVE